MKGLAKHADQAYALLRIMTGFMFAFHVAQVILRLFAEGMPLAPVGSQLWFGGLIELIGGLLVMAGFKTRWAAFLASGEMAVAYFQFHWKFQIGPAFFPAINKGEPAVLYCFVFLLIACRGGVMWCLDKKK